LSGSGGWSAIHLSGHSENSSLPGSALPALNGPYGKLRRLQVSGYHVSIYDLPPHKGVSTVAKDMAPVRYFIDRCTIFCGAVIVIGWHEKREPGATKIYIDHKNSPLITCFEEVHRHDLQEIFGGDAGSWGFTARAVLPSGQGDDQIESNLLIRIRASGFDETIIERPSERFVPGEVVEFYGMFEEFIGMIGQRDGRVLEIGARAQRYHPS
jgi:hypothetical protein